MVKEQDDFEVGEALLDVSDLPHARDQQVQTDEEDWDRKIVDAILNALPLKHQQGDSIKSFEDWLKWAKNFVITDKNMRDIWPTTWTETEEILRKVGYESPKHFFVCMSDEHPRDWDLMESPLEKCKHCGQTGNINYYYLGLSSKIKRWYSNPQMCQEMLGHWFEKDHWFNLQNNEGIESWPVKKELWDGTRFSEYSWFFDPEREWLLPVVCPHCKDHKLTSVISEKSILLEPGFESGVVNLICYNCRKLFRHTPRYAKGDPRNIVYIAHWDGFSPFGTSGGHSTGVLDVKIGNCYKEKRNHVSFCGWICSLFINTR